MSKERKLTKQEERRKAKHPETAAFLWHNENPRGHITGDCVIRALAGTTGLSWAEAVTVILDMMIRYALDQDGAARKYLEEQGWVKQKMPKHEDGSRFTGTDLVEYLNKYYRGNDGVFVTVAGHAYCIRRVPAGGTKRYKVVDIWDSTGKAVCNYWTKG